MLARHIRSFGARTCGYIVSSKRIQQNTCRNNFTSVQVDVPWGKIDGKLWGSGNKQPILAVHGWMDNAGSFDHIAPLIENHPILAIDLPGHGKSSWLPRGIPYDDKIYMIALRTIIKKFGWSKVKLLGHSMGGVMCFNYSRLFPEEVQFVVALDILAFLSMSQAQQTRLLAYGIDKLMEFEKKMTSKPPTYTENEIIVNWIKKSQFQSLDEPAVRSLMKRGCEKTEEGQLFYTRDFRLSIPGFGPTYSRENCMEMAKSITSPYMVVRAADGPFTKDTYWTIIGDVLKKSSQDFQYVKVEGTHHFHMTNAKEVAAAINPFLDKHNIS
ncbi:probable serine hydrolase [Trichogramma pretiosum]|uniref:probable serine hydrolase n=1 Tax=Trichogramma pretiosum TaxID=7493 RepID=UPI0006C945BC|nr:probable serine hydrolase [Trichogramma pretiosum]